MQLVAKPLIRQMTHGVLSRDLQRLEVEAGGTAGTNGGHWTQMLRNVSKSIKSWFFHLNEWIREHNSWIYILYILKCSYIYFCFSHNATECLQNAWNTAYMTLWTHFIAIFVICGKLLWLCIDVGLESCEWIRLDVEVLVLLGLRYI